MLYLGHLKQGWPFMSDENELCLRCGFPESHQKHNRKSPPPEGWHPFRGQDYLNALEDALLFVRENNQPHQWEETGVTIDIYPSFDEMCCKICGAINWGGHNDGVCFGNREAESAITAAHNRRAVSLARSRISVGKSD
jgi:hypothetical protein